MKCGTATPVALHAEKSATLTITASVISGAGEGLGKSHKCTTRGWNIKGQFLMNRASFTDFIKFATTQKSATWQFFSDYFGDGLETSCFQGFGYLTSLSFAGQGRGLVAINIQVTGSGKPDYQTITSNTLRYDVGKKYDEHDYD